MITNNKQKFLKFKDLKELASELRFSNGFYGRLYNELEQITPEHRKSITRAIRQSKITTKLDLILWLER